MNNKINEIYLNPWTLRFEGVLENLEEKFIEDYNKSKVKYQRNTIIFGLVAILLFAFADLLLFPDAIIVSLFIRFILFMPVAIFLLYLSYKEDFYKKGQIIIAAYALYATILLLVIYYISAGYGVYSYRYAVLLMFIYLYLFSTLRFKNVLLTSLIILAMYNLFYSLTDVVPTELHMDATIMYIFIIITGSLSAYYSEMAERQSFYQSIQQSEEKAKIELINNNLEKKVMDRTLELSITNENLQISEKAFRSLYEEAGDAILIIEDRIMADYNQAFEAMFVLEYGFDFIGKDIRQLVKDFDDETKNALEKFLERTNEDKSLRIQGKLFKRNHQPMILQMMLTRIDLIDQEIIHALVRDITKERETVDNLEYISYHDQLTGLYNRLYFNRILNELRTKENMPMMIIMADVNGLKLINDTFGYEVGDQYLIKVGQILKFACRKEDIIARLSGDEFAIICPKAEMLSIGNLILQIKKEARIQNIKGIQLSISLGYAMMNKPEDSLDEVLKLAEDHMQERKVFESPTMRRKTIDVVIKTLHEKNLREELHSRRVSELSKILGKAIHLSEEKIDEIEMVGLLHDIGKIGVDENILNKTGRLTEEEYEAVKQHPEIGFRILNTSNEMLRLSNYVLYHHERWDGKGYPTGIKGDNIPLQSRIIAIVDTFDAITSERPYRPARSIEAALKELQENSGTQFDPYLVTAFVKALQHENMLSQPQLD
ncbi:MAG: diguanylate cyclase [Firmicutes bacterium HGW-Firmicutes-5]|nr:MAG: diguanylate cyclase [Firmicutes bacterium HGW-Firmicutes-5]